MSGLREVYLGLGSNVGDRWERLRWAVAAIRRWPEVERLRASSVYETAHVGEGPVQDDYLNQCLCLDTRLSPEEIHRRAKQLEREAGRTPDSHGDPRPLDVDLLWDGGERRPGPDLILPHPRLTERRFVLEPLAELGLTAGLDARGRSALELCTSQRIRTQRVRRLGPGTADPVRGEGER